MILSPNCVKCGNQMIKGFIADHTYGSSTNAVIQNIWVEGDLKTNWMGARIKDNRKFLTTTFRCSNCGYLESYATEEK